ncbi:hypothetical protein BBN63_19400 [Streptomyces niveus]|uniref:Uncharacterized protein n=1 Tax=Streptomyces niveus TaxID=193462 RepID=A0A1U9QVN7_STRNV|nr:hypothetical protein BBN63_19400 [Streptomyces niveus]
MYVLHEFTLERFSIGEDSFFWALGACARAIPLLLLSRLFSGFTFYWDTGCAGASYLASRNSQFLTFYGNNNEFSSLRKTGC